MQVLLFFVLLILVLYILFRRADLENNSLNELQAEGVDKEVNFPYRVAYISRRNLFEKRQDHETEQLLSPYVQNLFDKSELQNQLHGWKQNTSLDTRFAGDTGEKIVPHIPAPEYVSAQYTSPEKVLYFLKDNKFGGLFELDTKSGTEKRIMHKQGLYYSDLSLNVEANQLLCTSYEQNGIANIVLLDEANNLEQRLTAGDTEDVAPAWIGSAQDAIVFQSTGLARDEGGYCVARGPASIQMLDIKNGTLSSIVEDLDSDYLQPRVNMDGDLLYLKRPYLAQRVSTWQVVADSLLFPFRLFRAVFSYLIFFSLMYTKKPLTTGTGNPYSRDLKNIVLRGMRIDAEKALSTEAKIAGVPSLVPSSWQLIRRSSSGVETLLATNVLSYDLDAEQRICYSNGCGVFVLNSSGRSQLLFRGELIESIFVSNYLT